MYGNPSCKKPWPHCKNNFRFFYQPQEQLPEQMNCAGQQIKSQ